MSTGQLRADVELRKLSIAIGDVPMAYCVLDNSHVEIRERGDIDERWVLVAKGATAREVFDAARHNLRERIEAEGARFRKGRDAALEHNRSAARKQVAERAERRGLPA